MGTRNMTFVVESGEYRVAQYGQWDGYPSGQGLNIVDFMREQDNRDQLRRGLGLTRLLIEMDKNSDQEHPDVILIKAYNDACPGAIWVDWPEQGPGAKRMVENPDKRTGLQKHWFEKFISRDIGSEILKEIAALNEGENNGLVPLRNETSFAADSLFCEWAYAIDFDRNVLEVYRGFNSTIPLTELDRFHFLQQPDGQPNSDGYYPIIKIIEFSLDALPANKDFCDMCEKAAEQKFPEEAEGEESEPVTEEGGE